MNKDYIFVTWRAQLLSELTAFEQERDRLFGALTAEELAAVDESREHHTALTESLNSLPAIPAPLARHLKKYREAHVEKSGLGGEAVARALEADHRVGEVLSALNAIDILRANRL